MARPRIAATEKRRNLTVRFSAVERAQLEIEAEAQGTVLADYIRQLCERHARTAVRPQPRPLEACTFAAVHRFGSLVNVMTKTANQNRHLPPDLASFCDRGRFFIGLTVPEARGLDREAADQLRRIGVNLVQLRNVADANGEVVPPALSALQAYVESLLMEAIAA